MHTFQHTNFNGINDIPHLEISGAFSITKNGLHLEVIKSEDNLSFKIFDLITTKLLQEGEIKADLHVVN